MKEVIAVTGPMAAGKNYVCTRLEKEGWSCIDADILVHDAIGQCAAEITQAFSGPAKKAGLKITNEDGSINRRELGKLLFSDKSLLAKQESIVYPVITKTVYDFIENHEKSVINATVLYKTPEILNLCGKILYVKAPLIIRLKRAKKRDGMPLSQILRRFYAQRNLLKEYKKSGKEICIIKNYS